MQKKYIVTSSGIKAGKPYATLCPIIEGTKANGDSYSFINTDTPEKEDEVLPVTSIHYYEITRSTVKKPL